MFRSGHLQQSFFFMEPQQGVLTHTNVDRVSSFSVLPTKTLDISYIRVDTSSHNAKSTASTYPGNKKFQDGFCLASLPHNPQARSPRQYLWLAGLFRRPE